jgi:hypothetical protein
MKKLLVTALLTLTASAWAQTTVKVEDAWVRGTVSTQKASGAFMRLTPTANARLVSASSPVAGVVEIHEMAMENDIMRMRQVPGLDLAAGRTVELKPGGYHVMLLDLKAQVKEGDVVPVTLVFEGKDGKRENVEIQAPVRPLNSAAAAGGMKPGMKGEMKGDMKPTEAHKH